RASIAEARLRQMEIENNATLKSWLGRVTAPLRRAGQNSRSALRPALELALKAVRQNPRVKAPLWALGSLSPMLKRKLVRFAEARSSVAMLNWNSALQIAPEAGRMAMEQGSAVLEVRAWRILADLSEH